MSLRNSRTIRFAFAVSFATVAILIVTTTRAQQQGKAQQACIVAVNKAVGGVAKAQAKNQGACLKAAGRAFSPAVFADCVGVDLKGKVARARANLTATIAAKCASVPDFGFSGDPTASDAAVAQELGLLADLFGDDLASVAISADSDPAAARCQQIVLKATGKILQAQIATFAHCKKDGLKRGTIDSQAQLATCLDAVVADDRGKIGRTVVKLADVAAKACEGVDMSTAFPGDCSPTAFADCVQDESLCRACLLLDEADDTGVFCDEHDDGVANASCVDPRRCGNATVEPGEECDDGNTVDADCCSATCTVEPAAQPCADDGNICTDDVCDGNGACAHVANTDPCDDGLYCTGSDTCSGGSCSTHSGDPCTGGGECAGTCNEAADTCNEPSGTTCTDDGNECTADICDGAGVCSHPNLAGGTDCGDATAGECTSPDTCDGAGACVANDAPSGTACGSPSDDDCTDPDTCDGVGACLSNDTASGTACGSPSDDDCTDPDTCDGGGACLSNHVATGSACGDPTDDDCTAPDTCDAAGACQPNDVVAGSLCTDDGSPCTDDICNASGVCTHPNLAADTACGDGSDTDCTDPDTCDGLGVCQSNHTTPGAACTNDGNQCTNDVCNGTGACTHPNLPSGTSCGDPASTVCTAPDTCNGGGTCLANHAASGAPCTSDGNECTIDQCDGAGTCAHPGNPSGTACTDDGNECTNDQCNGTGSCSHPPKASGTACTNDGNVCTNDQCNGTGACIHPNNTVPCNDGLFCNGADTCAGGSCSAHAGNPCPGPDGDGNCQESCNESTDSCTASDPNGAACNDGQSCNGADSCSGGACVGSGVCCGTRDFTFTVNSNNGGVFDSAEWPGGTQAQTSSSGCSVTINNPNDNIDLVCTLAAPFSINGFSGFQSCFGTGGEDGDGCQPVSCPPAGIGSCCSARPSCSAALNGSGSARYFVRCVDP